MWDRGLALAGGLALMLCSVTIGWTQIQTDASKLLVGRWNGDTHGPSGIYDRTLIIKSVEDRNGQLVAAGEYGGPGGTLGGKLYPVRGMVEEINGEIVIRFLTPDRRTAVLTLQKDGKRLMGPTTGAAQVGRSALGDDSLSLRKVD